MRDIVKYISRHSSPFIHDGRAILDATLQPYPAGNRYATTTYMDSRAHIAYELGLISHVQTAGYQRFFHVGQLVRLRDHFSDPATGILKTPMLSQRAAEECIAFAGQGWIEQPRGDFFLAVTPIAKAPDVKLFMQHTGLIMSPRQAEDILRVCPPQDGTEAKKEIKSLIAESNDISGYEDDISLYPTGMAAIYKAFQVLSAEGSKTIQLGFPYVDSIKLQEKFGEGCVYIPYESEADLVILDAFLADHYSKGEKIAGLFTEIPSNPKLHTVKLPRLRKILDKYNIPLVIDDTVGTSENVDVKPYADFIATSLTKFFSGANAMGGSLIINRRNEDFYTKYKYAMEKGPKRYEDLLYGNDARVLAQHGRSFGERMRLVNENALIVADVMAGAGLKHFWHPSTVDTAAYDDIKKQNGGYGGLASLTFSTAARAIRFHDAYDGFKGPGLGFQETGICMINTLTHFPFDQRRIIHDNGMSMFLTRMSVGTEHPDDLRDRLTEARDYALAL